MSQVEVHNPSVLLEMHPSGIRSVFRTIFTLGIWLIWKRRRIYRLTPIQLTIESGLIARHEEEIPLSRITSVTLQTRLAGGAVRIATGSGEMSAVLDILSRRDARMLADATKQAVAAIHEATNHA